LPSLPPHRRANDGPTKGPGESGRSGGGGAAAAAPLRLAAALEALWARLPKQPEAGTAGHAAAVDAETAWFALRSDPEVGCRQRWPLKIFLKRRIY
jgi:hypothetical protein